MANPEPPVAPQVGAPLSKATVNAQVGTDAQNFKKGIDGLVARAKWAEAYDTPMLVALGFTEEEAGILKSALGEVPAIAEAVDATTFLERLWGVA